MDECIIKVLTRLKELGYNRLTISNVFNRELDNIFRINFSEYNYNQTLEYFSNIVDSNQKIGSKTKHHYKLKLKNIFSYCPKYNNPVDLFSDVQYVCDSIDNKFSNINSRKVYYQVILVVITHIHLNIPKERLEEYENKFQNYNDISKVQTIHQSSEQILLSFDEIQERAKIFEEYGLENFIIELYKQAPLRNDYFNCIIIKNESEIIDKNCNYLIWPNGIEEETTFILQEYKTSKKYGLIKILFNPKISKFLINLNKKHGDWLLMHKTKTENELTEFMCFAFIKMKIDTYNLGPLNYLRHVGVSTELKKNITPEDRLKLAHKIAHNPITSTLYNRKLEDA